METITKKGSNVPEKPKTPQQLWYNHEKKAFLKTRPDVSIRNALSSRIEFVPLYFFIFRHQATTKDIKDSLGKQWTQLPDKKRLKWISKSLEQQKVYEVRVGDAEPQPGSSLLC